MIGEQLSDGHPKRRGEALDVVDGDIPHFALNVRHECAMQPRLKGKVFL